MPNGSVAGELAESWEATPDAATWEFKLRKGVEFHNGKSLEAQDVVESVPDVQGQRPVICAPDGDYLACGRLNVSESAHINTGKVLA